MNYIVKDRHGLVVRNGDEIFDRGGNAQVFEYVIDSESCDDYRIVIYNRLFDRFSDNLFASDFGLTVEPSGPEEYSVVNNSTGRPVKKGDNVTDNYGDVWVFDCLSSTNTTGRARVIVSRKGSRRIYDADLFNLTVEKV